LLEKEMDLLGFKPCGKGFSECMITLKPGSVFVENNLCITIWPARERHKPYVF